MPKDIFSDGSPTMIVPEGTRIDLDSHGQMSICTPGNLVLQNSGRYARIESQRGSIRIDPDVSIEAVRVECKETCFVAGMLTAWQVKAKTLQVEDTARVHVILQEAEHLELGRHARLSGNFSSEQELLGIFGRFAQQFRGLSFGRGDAKAGLDLEAPLLRGQGGAARSVRLPPRLFSARSLIQQSVAQTAEDTEPAVRELIELLEKGRVDTLRMSYGALFECLERSDPALRQAESLLREHFENGS